MNYKVAYLGGTEGYAATVDVLSGVADVIHVDSSSEALGRHVSEIHGILDASMRVPMTAELLARARCLKIVSCATTGSDHIDRGQAAFQNIPVLTLKEDREFLNNITPAAELSWALLMACARKLVSAVEHVRAGQWVREAFPGLMLNGRRLGLIGCGRIGGWMARYAKAFGMYINGYDPYIDTYPEGVTPTSLQGLFEACDFISIHVHLSEETRNLVSTRLLSHAKKGLILVNTSRGGVVDQDALLEGLESGHIGAAGLDVLHGEPDIENNALVKYARGHDNLLITPHCGGYSPDAVGVVCAHAAGKIRMALETQEA